MKKPLDLHKDTVPTAAGVLPAVRAAMRDASYVIRPAAPAICMTCGKLRELRLGHCLPCAISADPLVGEARHSVIRFDIEPGESQTLEFIGVVTLYVRTRLVTASHGALTNMRLTSAKVAGVERLEEPIRLDLFALPGKTIPISLPGTPISLTIENSNFCRVIGTIILVGG